MPSNRRRPNAQIMLHDRETNDVPTLGGTMDVTEEYAEKIRETELNSINITLRRDYRNRILHICKFLEKEFPHYSAIGVKKLTARQRNDRDQFHHKNDRDLVYKGLNVKFIKAFLTTRKYKSNGQMCCPDHIRKYKDAIVWGSKEAKQPLQTEFYIEMKKFLSSHVKETKKGKAQGLLDEREADPFSWALYEKVLKWAIQEKNLKVWVFTILQWNCMARSANIGMLAYHQLISGEDYIKVHYDKTKADQAGEKCVDKHLYANPLQPLVCPFLALAVWFSFEVHRLGKQVNLFGHENRNNRAPQQNFSYQLSSVLKNHMDTVTNYIRRNHANAHGIRKGAATFATSGTTVTPSVTSVANRGDWSMGHVLDVYWTFSDAQDFFLGRVLCGLDPNKATFATLPPHFKLEGNLMDDADIKQAMELMYGPILAAHSENLEINPTGMLLLLLPSIIHHSEWIKSVVRDFPGHPFSLIPLFTENELLLRLKEKVCRKFLCSNVNIVDISN